MSIYLAFINITATLTLRFIRAATMRSSGPDQVIYVEAYADTTADTDLVVNTGCHHYIQGHHSYSHSHLHPSLSNSNARDLRKIRIFRSRICTADQRRTHLLEVPILLEEVNFICAIYSGKMLEATQEWMWANPHKWVN